MRINGTTPMCVPQAHDIVPQECSYPSSARSQRAQQSSPNHLDWHSHMNEMGFQFNAGFASKMPREFCAAGCPTTGVVVSLDETNA